ncbi:MAG: matrixin family metalloprotease [Candidatus Pacebacteria bacterium]|nr:matrixin family metalloprotease [Candidatus Paceibacterota bacterium]MCF7856855.1 matrixin family metalloprotease [Candidatus Paceibacterota bacterium]
MRLLILIGILIATLFGSGFWYAYIDMDCKLPVKYKIGNIDERFGTDVNELKKIVAKAETVWESALQTELFAYDENASLSINLVFDERQEASDREAELRDDLQIKEGMSESVAEQYTELVGEYRALKKSYELRVGEYEEKLSKHNIQVTDWNNKGGAPQDVVDKLGEVQKALTEEQKSIEGLAKKLNQFVVQLNAIGVRGNSLITDYNAVVNKYNEHFKEVQEFTQGDYTGKAIDVYQFNSEDELTIVLAHEFGHALALGHVQNEKSIMYFQMNAQEVLEGLSAEDMNEFTQVCSQRTLVQQIAVWLKSIL